MNIKNYFLVTILLFSLQNIKAAIIALDSADSFPVHSCSLNTVNNVVTCEPRDPVFTRMVFEGVYIECSPARRNAPLLGSYTYPVFDKNGKQIDRRVCHVYSRK